MKKQIKTQGNKGITLIALVVTIVVLIILATVSINLVFNDNGIIQRAEQADTWQKQGEFKEDIKMAELESIIIDETGTEGEKFLLMKEVIADNGYEDKLVYLEGELIYIGTDEKEKEELASQGINTSLSTVINNIIANNPDNTLDVENEDTVISPLKYEDGYIRINPKETWGTGETGSITDADIQKLITNSEDAEEQAKVTFEDVEGKTGAHNGKKIYYNGDLLGILVTNGDVNSSGRVDSQDLAIISGNRNKKIEILGNTMAQIKSMDLDNDGEITEEDTYNLFYNYNNKKY